MNQTKEPNNTMMSKANRQKVIQAAKERWAKVKAGAQENPEQETETQETASVPDTSPREKADLNAQHAASSIEMVRTATVMPSTTNPRKNFDAGALRELTESIRAHGIIQPPLVRPVECGRWIIDEGVHHGKKSSVFFQVLDRTLIKDQRYIGPDPVRYATRAEAESVLPRFELVCGERRLRAAKECGLETIPVIVRQMSDKDVLEVQVIENLQRADLHPMEEAEGYEKLMAAHGYSAEDIAAKVGKDKSYVYKRIKLLALGEAGRNAFYDGTLTASTALLVARIPTEELQEEALKRIEPNCQGTDPCPYSEVQDIVHREFMLELRAAPFDIKAADLVSGAGACAACPKRTGNQAELFSDVKSGDVCTDPACFAQKKEAWSTRVIERAKAKGQTVLEGKEAKNLFYCGGTLRGNATFIDIESRCFETDKPATYKKLLGKHTPPTVLAIDDAGAVHHLIKKEDAALALKAAGVELHSYSDLKKADPDTKAREKAEKAKAKLEAKAVAAAVVRAREKVLDTLSNAFPEQIESNAWKPLFMGVSATARRDQIESFARNNGIEFAAYQAEEAVAKWARGQEPEKLARAVLDLACCTLVDSFGGEWRDEWITACQAAEVDLGALVKEEKARLAGKGKAVVVDGDELDMKIVDSLTTIPAGDGNFKSALERANLATLQEALKDPELSKAVRKAIDARIKKLTTGAID